MYIENGIAYTDESKQIIKVIDVHPLDNYILWVKFNTGESKTFIEEKFN